MQVGILNLGCITQDWQVPRPAGAVPVVLGYGDPASYLHNPAYLGAIVGRVANRISGARFELDGQVFETDVNEPPNTLHGGSGGLGSRLWEMEPDGDRAVRLRLVSADGDQGFPGRAEFTVTVSLKGGTLTYDMRAQVDRPTPISLAQHNYYNLMGSGDVRTHVMQLQANATTPTDEMQIPTGALSKVSGSRFDFSKPASFEAKDPDREGYDHNYVLETGNPAARLEAPNGLQLTLRTDKPGLQLYTAGALAPIHPAPDGQSHGPYGGVCLEPQGFPNAVNTPAFPDVVVSPEAPYSQKLSVTIEQGTSR